MTLRQKKNISYSIDFGIVSEPPLPDSRHLVARLARLQHVRQAPVTRHWEWSLEQGAIIIICSSTTAEGHVGITAYHRFGGVRA